MTPIILTFLLVMGNSIVAPAYMVNDTELMEFSQFVVASETEQFNQRYNEHLSVPNIALDRTIKNDAYKRYWDRISMNPDYYYAKNKTVFKIGHFKQDIRHEFFHHVEHQYAFDDMYESLAELYAGVNNTKKHCKPKSMVYCLPYSRDKLGDVDSFFDCLMSKKFKGVTEDEIDYCYAKNGLEKEEG